MRLRIAVLGLELLNIEASTDPDAEPFDTGYTSSTPVAGFIDPHEVEPFGVASDWPDE